MLQFKVYEGKELNNLGTVASFIPKGELKFVPGTIDRFKSGTIKAMCVILINAKGESTNVPLSKKVSSTILNAFANGATKKDALAAISKLEIVEDPEDETRNTICAPRGSGGEEETFGVATLTKDKVSYDDLVTW
jgi:hypothetical protein